MPTMAILFFMGQVIVTVALVVWHAPPDDGYAHPLTSDCGVHLMNDDHEQVQTVCRNLLALWRRTDKSYPFKWVSDVLNRTQCDGFLRQGLQISRKKRRHSSEASGGIYRVAAARTQNCINGCAYGAPDRTRTCYPRLRRPVLYPDELRARFFDSRCFKTRASEPGNSLKELWSG